MSSASDDSMRAVKMECASSANVRKTSMSRVRDCFIIMTLAGLTFGLATKAVSQGDTQKSHGEWRQYNGGYDATRFSPLTKINANNVGSLREVARFKIPETMSFQSNPVVVGGTLYVTTLHNTYAIDARTGQQRWMRRHDLKNPGPGRLGRGVAYADGRVFRGLTDGHVLAMNASTGDVIWDVIGADTKAGEFYNRPY